MNWEALSAIAELIGVLLVVISLVYLAIQVRQSNQMALAESELHPLVAYEEGRVSFFDSADARLSVALYRMTKAS